MKRTSATLCLLLLCYLCVNAQRSFLQTQSKKRNAYYVDVTTGTAMVYKMGVFYDKAATTPAIISTDTLLLQQGGSYVGPHMKMVKKEGSTLLVTGSRKKDRHRLEAVENPVVVTTRLNEAWYVKRYFAMADTINKSYPMDHHSFREAFYTWDKLGFKEMDYLQFRTVAGERLAALEDSIRRIHDAYMVTVRYIGQHITAIPYDTLEEKMLQLPPLEQYEGVGWYRGAMMVMIAEKRPAYFWKLAEDFPDEREMAFWAVRRDKKVMQELYAVQGYEDMKKAFAKVKRDTKKAAAMGTVSAIASAALLGAITLALF